MVTDPQSKPISLILLWWANPSIYLITPFLTRSCGALRRLLTAGNRSVSTEKRCGWGVSTTIHPHGLNIQEGNDKAQGQRLRNHQLFLNQDLVLSKAKYNYTPMTHLKTILLVAKLLVNMSYCLWLKIYIQQHACSSFSLYVLSLSRK